MVEAVTASSVKRAGRRLRRHYSGDEVLSLEGFNDCIRVIEIYRASHQLPLVKANNGLRSMVRTLRLDGQVSQRLKRMTTILDKIQSRERTLSLDRMQDIGGCRVVLPDIDSVRTLDRYIRTGRRPVVGYADYITSPRSSGYRGIHLVVDYGRPIEVQLRTRLQHEWALAVEELSALLGQNYKRDGNTDLQRFMECHARVLSRHEEGMLVDRALLDEHATLLAKAFPAQR